MASVVPINFRKSGENEMGSYNFYDVASGTGYVEFNAGKTPSIGMLADFAFYSPYGTTSVDPGVSGPAIKVIDQDFDVVINKPLQLQGVGFIQIPFMAYGDAAPAATCTAYVLAKLRKVPSGGAEADIVTSSNSQTITAGPGVSVHAVGGCSITIPTTSYNPGDTLRITTELWATNDAGNSTVRIAHDPKGRYSLLDSDGASTITWDSTGPYPTVLSFQCPIKIDL